jgi:hypothetical protein
MQTSSSLNPIQLHLLQMFRYTKSKKSLEDLKVFLAKFYADQVDDEMDKIWNEKKLSQKKLKDMAKEHFRTKSQKL